MKGLIRVVLTGVLVAACGRDGAITGPRAPNAVPVPGSGVLAIGVDPVTGASIETNKDDYSPGEIVHLVGKGWGPNETVNLHMTENPDTHADVDTNVVADASGEFSIHFYDVQPHDLGVTFTLTAQGMNTGSLAVATFTDGNPNSLTVTLAQNPNPVPAGQAATYTVQVIYTGTSQPCTVNLSATPTVSPAWPSPPIGGYFSFSPSSVTGQGSGGGTEVHPTSVLTVNTTASMIATTYSFTVTATEDEQSGEACQGDGFTSGPISLVVSAAPPADVATSLVLQDSPDSPTTVGTPVTFTATLTPNSATGTVNFYKFSAGQTCDNLNGATALASVSVNSGAAAYGPATLAVGSHTITACYVPDAGFLKSEDSETHVVNALTPTLTVQSNLDPSYFGDNVTFTATLTGIGSEDPDGGTINFAYGATSCNTTTGAITGGTSLGSGVIASSAASVSTTTLPVGQHDIMACYAGNGSSILGATGTYDDQDVNKATTSLGVTSDNDPSEFGENVTFEATVTVTNGSATPSGSVSFAYGAATCNTTTGAITGGTSLGSGAIASAKASVTVNDLPVGTHDILACYGGTSSIEGSEGTYDDQDVSAVSTTTTLAVAPASQQYSDKTVLTATVTPHTVLGSALTGTVHFYLGAAAVSCGTSAPAGAVGSDAIADADDGVGSYTHTIDEQASTTAYVVTACFYSSNTNFEDSNDTDELTVTKEDATVHDASVAPNNILIGGSGSLTFKVRETNGSVATEKNPQGQKDDGLVAAGDISNAGVSATAKGVLTQTNLTLSCGAPVSNNLSGYNEILTVTCTFGPVNTADTYDVDIDVTGNYYVGKGATLIQVTDPNAGFTTGGGWFWHDGIVGGDKVNFGFAAKSTQNKNKIVYQGSLLVIRHMANGDVIKIKSNVFEGYSIKNATQQDPCASATFSGKANYTVNGVSSGNFAFTGYGKDCGEPGTADMFGVYHALSPNGAATTTVLANLVGSAKTLAGGNIQVPQPSGKK